MFFFSFLSKISEESSDYFVVETQQQEQQQQASSLVDFQAQVNGLLGNLLGATTPHEEEHHGPGRLARLFGRGKRKPHSEGKGTAIALQIRSDPTPKHVPNRLHKKRPPQLVLQQSSKSMRDEPSRPRRDSLGAVTSRDVHGAELADSCPHPFSTNQGHASKRSKRRSYSAPPIPSSAILLAPHPLPPLQQPQLEFQPSNDANLSNPYSFLKHESQLSESRSLKKQAGAEVRAAQIPEWIQEVKVETSFTPAKISPTTNEETIDERWSKRKGVVLAPEKVKDLSPPSPAVPAPTVSGTSETPESSHAESNLPPPHVSLFSPSFFQPSFPPALPSPPEASKGSGEDPPAGHLSSPTEGSSEGANLNRSRTRKGASVDSEVIDPSMLQIGRKLPNQKKAEREETTSVSMKVGGTTRRQDYPDNESQKAGIVLAHRAVRRQASLVRASGSFGTGTLGGSSKGTVPHETRGNLRRPGDAPALKGRVYAQPESFVRLGVPKGSTFSRAVASEAGGRSEKGISFAMSEATSDGGRGTMDGPAAREYRQQLLASVGQIKAGS